MRRSSAARAGFWSVLLVAHTVVGQQVTRPYVIDWAATSKVSAGSCFTVERLQLEGGAYFHVNGFPIPTSTVPGHFVRAPNRDEANLFRAPFAGALFKPGMNEIYFGVTTANSQDHCTISSNVIELVSPGIDLNPLNSNSDRLALFAFSRNGVSFEGVTSVKKELRELDPSLYRNFAAAREQLDLEIAILMRSSVRELDLQRRTVDDLNRLKQELEALVSRPLSEIQDSDLDAILARHGGVLSRYDFLKENLIAILSDLRKGMAQLRDEVSRVVAEFRAQMVQVDQWSLTSPPSGQLDLNDPRAFEPAMSKDAVPEVEIPDLGVEEPWDDSKDPYALFAEQTLAALEGKVSNGTVTDRTGFLSVVRLWRFNQDAFEGALRVRSTYAHAEMAAHLRAQQRVTAFLSTYLEEGDWFKDVPVRSTTKEYIKTASKCGVDDRRKLALHSNLNEWRGRSTSIGQNIVLDLIDALWGGCEAISTGAANGAGEDQGPGLLQKYFAMVDGVTSMAKDVALLAVRFSPAGDAIDLCEVVTGWENCVPGGNQLSAEDRVLSGLGLIAGNGAFWRGIGTVASTSMAAVITRRIAKHSDEIVEAARGVAPHAVRNALSGFRSRTFNFGDSTFLLDKKGMKHILERHHPAFWNGTVTSEQSFLRGSMSVDDVADVATSVLQQNRDLLIQRGAVGRHQIRGSVDGVEYVLGLNNGRVGQLYPR